MCRELRVPLAEDKTIEPTTCLTFLRLQIDSAMQMVSVPEEKILGISEKISAALNTPKISLKSLQSLIGSLSFICRAVAPGRAFLRRLIDLTKGVKKPWHKIQITKGARADLNLWQVFLQGFNGKAMIPDQFWVLD